MIENQRGDAMPHREPGGAMRPQNVEPVALATVSAALGLGEPTTEVASVPLTGVTLDSRAVQPGDLYCALPGASSHGADFAAQAVAGGAVAVLTDPAGAATVTALGVPVLVAADPRSMVGRAAALIYGATAADTPMPLYGVTGTNGKTTTTYFVTSLLRALGYRTGLIGTIEILAGGEAVPSKLTTPESPDVHALLALMRERGLGGAAMEVSSHAISFRRVDGVVFDVAGFTNLTQDHLDLHGSMEEYFAAKAQLFTPERCRQAVVTVDDPWGRQLAETATVPVTTLSTTGTADAQWRVAAIEPEGLGHRFELHGPDGALLRLKTGLPGLFNVSNAALAVLMVLVSGAPRADVQHAIDEQDALTVEVPGRMQLVGTRPASIVDFAHNPDALERALLAVRPAGGGRVLVVFGATGQRDAGKRPLMGEIAARLADVVIVTDDDPHDEDAAAIRREVLAGASAAAEELGPRAPRIEEVFPRAEAILRAVKLATEDDVVLVAGRGHEVWQEVRGVNLALDDREELRRARTAAGFTQQASAGIES